MKYYKILDGYKRHLGTRIIYEYGGIAIEQIEGSVEYDGFGYVAVKNAQDLFTIQEITQQEFEQVTSNYLALNESKENNQENLKQRLNLAELALDDLILGGGV